MKHHKKGMTLVELIVSMALISILIVFCGLLIKPLLTMSASGNQRIQAKEIAQVAMAYLKEEVHCAKISVMTGYQEEMENIYWVNELGLLVNRGTIAAGLTEEQMQGNRLSVRFVPRDKAVSITVEVLDETNEVLYSLTTSVAAADPSVSYLGESSTQLSLTKRNSCP